MDIDLALKDASPREIGAKDADGNTVLSWSARCPNEHTTRALLRHGAEHHHISRFGSAALHFAAGASVARLHPPKARSRRRRQHPQRLSTGDATTYRRFTAR